MTRLAVDGERGTRRAGILCPMSVDLGLSGTFTPSKLDGVDVEEVEDC